jgi:hypothetical protein
LLPPPPPLLHILRTLELLHSPRAQALDAREASCAEEQDGQERHREFHNQLGTIYFQAEGSG